MNTKNQPVTDFQAIFEANPDATFILGTQGQILLANRAAMRRYGYSLAEFQQMSAVDLAGSQLQAQVLSRIQKSFLSDDQFDWVHKRKDGSELPVEIFANPLVFQGEPAICASVRDISGRVRDAQALREREQQLRAIADHAPVLLAQCGANKHYRFVNLPYAELFGLHPSDIVGKHPREILGEEAYAFTKPHMDAALAGQTVSYDLDLSSTPGGMHSMAVSYVPERDQAGNVVGFIAAITDITARKQAESALIESSEKLNLFIKHAPSAIAMFDRDMRYIACSNRWLLDYGLKDQVLTGRSHYEIFPDLPERWKDIHRSSLSGMVEGCDEDPFPRADGTVDWVRWETRPWYRHKGEIGGILIFSEVITERKVAEEKVREQLDELLRWQAVTVGREQRVQQLKAEVNELLAAQHQALRYTEPK